MVMQRDRNRGDTRRGLIFSFLIIVGFLVVSSSYYMWANDHFSKDLVAAIFVGVEILSILVISILEKQQM